MRVTAAVARQSGLPVELCSVELADPQAGEVVVRLVAAAIGARDLQAIAGQSGAAFPFVPGAEAAGIVERLGANVHHLQAGDAVVLGFAAAEQIGGRRADGSAVFSEAGGSIDGFIDGYAAFATHILCRADAVVSPAPEDPLELLAPLCGEVLLGAAPLLRMDGNSGPIVIVGATCAGLVATMIGKALGIGKIVVCEPDRGRHALAGELGATAVIADVGDLAATTRSLHADGAKLALIFADLDGSEDAAFASLCADGVVVSGAVSPADRAEVRRAESLVDQAVMAPQLLALQRTGVLPLEKLIDFFPFEQINDALAAVQEARVTKAVLRFQLGGFGALDRALEVGAAAQENADDRPAEAPVAELDGDAVTA